ncbi:hypothetical protein JCM8547_004309 [Rhodosporidiobolus lusitaniae]
MGDQHATQLYHQLKQEFNKGDNADKATLSSLLVQLKIALSELSLLTPSAASPSSSSSSTTPDVGALTTAREVLEIGALHSIRVDDVPGFERYLALLGTYYDDFASLLPASTNEAPLTALSLLRLLSQNRIAEFHTLLEALTLNKGKKAVVESKQVGWVLHLERSLMEGSYSRVWQLCRPSPSSSTSTTSSTSNTSTSLPLAEFAHFTPLLLATVRNEIAACDERAYESLPLRDARTLLFFEREEEVKAFAAERNWHLDPTTSLLHFPSSPLHPSRLSSTTSTGVPSSFSTGLGGEDQGKELDRNKVIGATLGYARELESIV